MKYKAICFDVDGTLYPADFEAGFGTKLALRHPWVSAKYGKTRVEFRKCQKDFKSVGLEDKDFGYREAAMFYRCFKRIGSVERARAYLDRRYYKRLYQYFQGLQYQPVTVELFKMLKDRGYTIGILSDWPLWNKLELIGVEQYCDFKCDPDKMMFLKPDTHTFEYLLYNLKLDASEVLYVGDSYNKDIEGATGAGIDAVLIGKTDGSKYPKALKVFKNLKEFTFWMEAN